MLFRICWISKNKNDTHAFNSFSRNFAYKSLNQQCPTLCNWFNFLDDTYFRSNLDYKLHVDFKTGGIQGMGTTGVIYNAIKWATEKDTINQVDEITNGEFGFTMKVDYHDGITMIDYRYLKDYIHLIIKNYSIPGISINRSKSEVIAKTKDENIKKSIWAITIDINDDTNNIKSNFDGDIYFCGVPHGSKNLSVKNWRNIVINGKFELIILNIYKMNILNIIFVKNFIFMVKSCIFYVQLSIILNG